MPSARDPVPTMAIFFFLSAMGADVRESGLRSIAPARAVPEVAMKFLRVRIGVSFFISVCDKFLKYAQSIA
jgi:hypothetical protein